MFAVAVAVAVAMLSAFIRLSTVLFCECVRLVVCELVEWVSVFNSYNNKTFNIVIAIVIAKRTHNFLCMLPRKRNTQITIVQRGADKFTHHLLLLVHLFRLPTNNWMLSSRTTILMSCSNFPFPSLILIENNRFPQLKVREEKRLVWIYVLICSVFGCVCWLSFTSRVIKYRYIIYYETLAQPHLYSSRVDGFCQHIWFVFV